MVLVAVLVFGILSLVPTETPWWEEFVQPEQEDQDTDETARYHQSSTAYPSWAYYVRQPHVTPAMFCVPMDGIPATATAVIVETLERELEAHGYQGMLVECPGIEAINPNPPSPSTHGGASEEKRDPASTTVGICTYQNRDPDRVATIVRAKRFNTAFMQVCQ